MNNYIFSNAFGFREYTFLNSHSINFSKGTRYNYVNYLVKGHAEIIGENFSITLNEGDVVYIPRGLKYRSRWHDNSQVIYKSFSFLNYPSTSIKMHQPQKIFPTEKIKEYINQLPTDNDVTCFSVGTLFLLLDELFKLMNVIGNDKKTNILEKAMNYMRLNPQDSIPSVAKACNVSVSALYLLFSNHMNCTPSEFKLNTKLGQAMHYLITTDIPIEEISDRCGFSSSSYFRKNFTKKYNCSPREARKDPYHWESSEFI